MTDWTDYRYAVIDAEGNGRQPPDLVELGIVPITNGVIGDPATWLFKPTAPIMPMARRIWLPPACSCISPPRRSARPCPSKICAAARRLPVRPSSAYDVLQFTMG